MQRTIAWLLLSVFLLAPFAPAAVAMAQPVAQHCVRKPFPADAAPSGIQCHEAAGHAHHNMAATAPAASPASAPSDHQFGSNGCCTSHDCCNSTVRAQWAQFTPSVSVIAVEFVEITAAVDLFSPGLAPRYDSHSGRAPPIS
jgi:hypothetical protein